jgi:hypothetical protein
MKAIFKEAASGPLTSSFAVGLWRRSRTDTKQTNKQLKKRRKEKYNGSQSTQKSQAVTQVVPQWP